MTLPSRSRLVAIGFAVLAVALGLWLVFGRDGDDADGAARLHTVTRGDLVERISAQGTLEPRTYVDVGAQVSGQIKKFHVAIGDRVRRGDRLADIDPRLYQSRLEADLAQLAALRAQRTQGQATLRLARIEAARYRRLLAQQAVSQDALDQAEAALAVAQASVEAQDAAIAQQESQIQTDRTNLAYTRIDAPIAGTVATLPLREGQTINSTQQAPTLMRIADFSVMTVRAKVAEADVPRLRVGMPARFMTLSAIDRPWQGTVRQIEPSPVTENDVVLFDVLIDVVNTGGALMTGMTTQVFFEAGAARGALLVPVTALGERVPAADSAAGRAWRVQLKLGKSIGSRIIHVGLTTRAQAAVMAGLKAGDQVVVAEDMAGADADSERGSGSARRARGEAGPPRPRMGLHP